MVTWVKGEDEGKTIGECPTGHRMVVDEVLISEDRIIGSCTECSFEVDKPVEEAVQK